MKKIALLTILFIVLLTGCNAQDKVTIFTLSYADGSGWNWHYCASGTVKEIINNLDHESSIETEGIWAEGVESLDFDVEFVFDDGKSVNAKFSIKKSNTVAEMQEYISQ